MAETDWTASTETSKPFDAEEQVLFLLRHDGKNDNRFLHDIPHYILLDSETRIFDNYEFAIAYAQDRKDKSISVWQYCDGHLHLLHRFSAR